MSNAQTRAKLNWEVACERLRFTLDRPDGADAQAAELPAAFEFVRTALEELQQAFGPDAARRNGKPGAS